ncbi:hypothetical protein [Mycolicibacterium sp. CR10]|uniref:hypothetical protein n=1 Tax=Mycolicibacterium sp. CR10 TaxID=2562314 RepID=UPI0010BFF573|nr:hypothetical protein [Mycolicibacterium sp. CR10]
MSHVEYEGELYAERLRRQAQAARLATGDGEWTEILPGGARIKIAVAWEDTIKHLTPDGYDFVSSFIQGRTLRSLANELHPKGMSKPMPPAYPSGYPNELLLSLIEVEHEALDAVANYQAPWGPELLHRRFGHDTDFSPEAFRASVNQVFQAYAISFHLHSNSRLVPVESHEMHSAVVEPVLYLLDNREDFSSAESAYQDALKELRNRDPGDAITDAGTALQEALKALGCKGNTLGDLLKSARNNGLIHGTDIPLTDAIIQWVAAVRNQGEAHTATHTFTMSDAWMVVHVVGALIIRLSESAMPDAP